MAILRISRRVYHGGIGSEQNGAVPLDVILAHAYEFGPLWLLVFAVIFLLWYFGTKWMEIYSAKTQAQSELDAKREDRKQEELEANIEHDREMAEIKGQMVEAMRESNALMDALKTLMESVVTSNKVLHDDLKASQAGSKQMQSDVKDMKNKVDAIYMKGV